MKEIRNIVIYNSTEDGKTVKESCIFYEDGTVLKGDENTAIKAIEEVATKRELSTKDIKELLNKETFFVITDEEEFLERFDSFLPKKEEKERIPGLIEVSAAEERQKVKDEEEVIIEEDYDESLNEPEESVSTESYYYENDESRDRGENENNNSGCLKLAVGIVAVGIGIAVLGYCATRCTRKSPVGTINTTNTITTTSTMDETTETIAHETTNGTENTTNTANNNDFYNDYKFTELLNVTKSEFQKEAMIGLAATINGFNGTFADNYVESGHDIKACLTYEEVVALQNAYNKYSKEEIKAYFNGYEVDATKMSTAYKSATLQLMGAHIIETSEHPVDITSLMDDQAGIDYYNYYHKLFLAAKEATGDEQLKLVKQFYDAVKHDFPITEKVRTEGISHLETHESLYDYQLSVIPMIDAAERIFQNLKVDYTLGNAREKMSTYKFMNGLSLCNFADDKFERIETIMLGASEDKENPTYEQYKTVIMDALVEKDRHFKGDEARELTNLRRFQEVINGDPLAKHHTPNKVSTGNNNNNNNTTRTYTKNKTTKKTVTETKNGGPIPSDKKAEIDKKIEESNKKAKEEAEKKAKEEAAKKQAEEDAKKKAIQESIAKANEEKKKKAEEEAKKDNSVKNVSPSSGPKQTLPKPNEYGKNFDDRVKVKTK